MRVTRTDNSLTAGSAIIGQVGIDQTTPGTTDSVTVKASAGIGSLTESAPGTDTASSGLNGRLQRIAQRLTSLIALVPASLGPKAEGSSFSVVPATPPATYVASYRIAVAASDLSLSFTFTANTDKHLVTIYHAVTATKLVKIRKISLFNTTNVAGTYGFEVRRLDGVTAPATGNPAITPAPYQSNSAAAEAVCLALPTTQGSVANVDTSYVTKHLSSTLATSAGISNWGMGLEEIVLYEYNAARDVEPLTMRAGVAEGFAVVGRTVATPTMKFTVAIEFSEE